MIFALVGGLIGINVTFGWPASVSASGNELRGTEYVAMTMWVNLMIRYRYWVMGIILLVTLGLMSQIGHLEVILSSDNMAPQSNHYIKTGFQPLTRSCKSVSSAARHFRANKW